MKKRTTGVILSAEEIATDIFELWIETELAEFAHPGQFIGIYPARESTLLPRPISICDINKEHTALRVVYRIAGKGTGEFSHYKSGRHVNILGILGNGYPLQEAEGKRVLLLGGGIGIPPLLALAKEISGKSSLTQSVLGYRNEERFLMEEFEQYGKTYIATEDGSYGTKGNVLNAIDDMKLNADIIYCCGPMMMLRAVKQFAQSRQISAYLSLEERMACGVGACLGCVCKTTKEDGHSHVHNARICTDGPVFEAGEVDI